MAVEYESIIQKMINELHDAKKERNNHIKMKRHIANVHILCELFLDESPSSSDDINDQEIKAMLGENKTQINNQQLSKQTDQENDGSIFDF